jgi:hypothetical protein
LTSKMYLILSPPLLLARDFDGGLPPPIFRDRGAKLPSNVRVKRNRVRMQLNNFGILFRGDFSGIF